MKASALEFRLRYWIHLAIFVLGFTAPWSYLASETSGFWSRKALWLPAAVELERTGLLSLTAATDLLLALGIAFVVAAALLRTWGAAYLGSSVVQDSAMHAALPGAAESAGVVADGPYRHLRNPLYLGTFLHAIGLGLLMPASGAAFAGPCNCRRTTPPHRRRRGLPRSQARPAVSRLQGPRTQPLASFTRPGRSLRSPPRMGHGLPRRDLHVGRRRRLRQRGAALQRLPGHARSPDSPRHLHSRQGIHPPSSTIATPHAKPANAVRTEPCPIHRSLIAMSGTSFAAANDPIPPPQTQPQPCRSRAPFIAVSSR